MLQVLTGEEMVKASSGEGGQTAGTSHTSSAAVSSDGGNEGAGRSESHSGTESRQQSNENTVATKELNGDSPHSKTACPNSKSSGTDSNPFSLSSSPSSKRKAEASLPRYLYIYYTTHRDIVHDHCVIIWYQRVCI